MTLSLITVRTWCVRVHPNDNDWRVTCSLEQDMIKLQCLPTWTFRTHCNLLLEYDCSNNRKTILITMLYTTELYIHLICKQKHRIWAKHQNNYSSCMCSLSQVHCVLQKGYRMVLKELQKKFQSCWLTIGLSISTYRHKALSQDDCLLEYCVLTLQMTDNKFYLASHQIQAFDKNYTTLMCYLQLLWDKGHVHNNNYTSNIFLSS